MRGVVVPDVVGDGVGGERAAGVRLQQRHRDARLVRQVVVLEEVVLEDDLPHLLLELLGLGVRPVLVPAVEIAGPRAAAGIEPRQRLRELGRVAARAGLREDDLAARELLRVRFQIGRAAGSVLEQVRRRGGQEEVGDAGGLRLGGLPEARVGAPHLDLDRRDGLAAHQRIEVPLPLLAEQPDVDVHPVERSQGSHRIGAVLEHARRQDGVRLLEKLGERPAREIVVELFVVLLAARQGLLAPPLGQGQPRIEAVDGVHRARIVDVVGGDQRGVEGTRTRGVEELVGEAGDVRVPTENAIDPEVLGADVRRQVGPRRVLRVGGRMDRARADVAEGAGHADPVGPYEVLAQVVAGIAVIALRIPGLGRLLVEVRIGEQPQAHDTGGIAVEGPGGQVLAPGSQLDARIFGLVFEGVRGAVGLPRVEPQAVTVRIRALGFLEAGLVDQAEIPPAVVTAIARQLRALGIGIGGDRLQEIEVPHALQCEVVPQVIVPSRPHDPVVASDDLGLGQIPAAIHVMEVVLVRGGERRGGAAGQAGLVHHLPRVRAWAWRGGRLPIARAAGDCGEKRKKKQAQQVRTAHWRRSFLGAVEAAGPWIIRLY